MNRAKSTAKKKERWTLKKRGNWRSRREYCIITITEM
jgi:hypothetical protein